MKNNFVSIPPTAKACGLPRNSFCEDEVSWSCIEKYIPYTKVVWSTHKNGISTYKLLDENGKKIDIVL